MSRLVACRPRPPFAEAGPTMNGFMFCPLHLRRSAIRHPGLPPKCGFLLERRSPCYPGDQRRELGSARSTPGQSQWARFNELTDAGEQDVLSRNDAGNENAVSAGKLSLEPIEKMLVARGASRGVAIFFMSDPRPLQLRHRRRRHAERL